MSSSSALMVATFLCLSAVNDLPARELYRRNIDSDLSLAEYLGTIENGQTYGQLTGDAGVGTFGGSEDHTAMLCCQAGTLNEYAYCPVHFRRAIDLDEKLTFAIASSGVTAVKTGAARERYNQASKLASAVVAEWRQATGRDDLHIAEALRSDPDAAQRLRTILRCASRQDFTPEQMTRRLEHFLIEDQQVIPAAGDALEAGDLPTFGRLVDRSQEAAEQLLGNQIPETVHLAQTAREGGAVGASSFGAGFGGSVWALVRSGEAEEFLRNWARRYEQRFPDRIADGRFFLTRPAPAAFSLV
jgi:galactokinase